MEVQQSAANSPADISVKRVTFNSNVGLRASFVWG